MFEVLKKYPLVEGSYILISALLILLFSIGNYFLIALFAIFVGVLLLMKTPLFVSLILATIIILLISIGVYNNYTSPRNNNPKIYKQKIKSLDLME